MGPSSNPQGPTQDPNGPKGSLNQIQNGMYKRVKYWSGSHHNETEDPSPSEDPEEQPVPLNWHRTGPSPRSLNEDTVSQMSGDREPVPAVEVPDDDGPPPSRTPR